MATATRRTTATPEAVWAVLADGWMYANWVVGTSHMRAVEATWPAVGSKLFHASGLWPVVRRDETEVEESAPFSRLVVRAKARPFGEARVVLEIASDGEGSDLSMTEVPVRGPGKLLHNPVADLVLLRRNVEALARLAALAERRRHPAD